MALSGGRGPVRCNSSQCFGESDPAQDRNRGPGLSRYYLNGQRARWPHAPLQPRMGRGGTRHVARFCGGVCHGMVCARGPAHAGQGCHGWSQSGLGLLVKLGPAWAGHGWSQPVRAEGTFAPEVFDCLVQPRPASRGDVRPQIQQQVFDRFVKRGPATAGHGRHGRSQPAQEGRRSPPKSSIIL